MTYLCATVPEEVIRMMTPNQARETQYLVNEFFRGRVQIRDDFQAGQSHIYVEERDWPREPYADYNLQLPGGYVLRLKAPPRRPSNSLPLNLWGPEPEEMYIKSKMMGMPQPPPFAPTPKTFDQKLLLLL